MRRIASIIRASDQGVSRPFLCKDDDNACWWCKGHLSGKQTQRLEWVCAHLARLLSLPVPDFEIMEVPIDLFELWRSFHRDCGDIFVTSANPFVFSSRHIPGCQDLSENSPFLTKGDRVLQARIFVFDQLIRNTDRTDVNSNVLVDAFEKAIHVIDHNNAFDPAFDEKSFFENHVFRKAYLALSPKERSDLTEDIHHKISAFDLEAVWNEMPEAWTAEIETGLTMDNVRSILCTPLNPLP